MDEEALNGRVSGRDAALRHRGVKRRWEVSQLLENKKVCERRKLKMMGGIGYIVSRSLTIVYKAGKRDWSMAVQSVLHSSDSWMLNV